MTRSRTLPVALAAAFALVGLIGVGVVLTGLVVAFGPVGAMMVGVVTGVLVAAVTLPLKRAARRL